MTDQSGGEDEAPTTVNKEHLNKLGNSGDPMTLVMFALAVAGMLQSLTGWREDWQRRTAVGKVGFVVGIPYRLFEVLVGLAGTILFGSILLVETLPSAAYRLLKSSYKKHAFKANHDQ